MFRFKTWTATAAVGGALAGSLLIAEPAHAQSTYEGRVTANGGLLVRHLPTTSSAVEGNLSKGQQIEIICKVRGSSVNGNDLWYSLPPTLNEWVAARYVQDIGPAPRWCGSSERFVGRATTALSKRAAPTTASAKVGSVARGAGVDISLGSCWGHGSPRVRTPVRRHVPAGTFRQPAPSAADGAGLAGCSAPLTTLVNLGHRQVVCAFVAAVLTLVRAPSAIQNLPVLAELARVR